MFNPRSGAGDQAQSHARVAAVLEAAARPHRFVAIERPEAIGELARTLGERACDSDGMVVAAGGDGTINAVVQGLIGSGCRFGVLPMGTFNYFARNHRIPLEPEGAARILITGAVRPVQVGTVNHRVFLVNASLGLYPRLLEQREQAKRQFGRSRLVALLSALFSLLVERGRLRLQLHVEGIRDDVETSTLFVGNNPLQLAQLGLPSDLQPPAAAADAQADPQQHGRLTAIMLRPVGTLEMIGLMAHGALGTLGEAPSVQHFRCTRLTVHLSPYQLGRRRVKVALDGEVTRMSGPLEFRVLETPLQLLACDNQPDSSGGGG